MAEYEFTVTEPMSTANVYTVLARTRAEAIAKVLDGEFEFCERAEAVPDRPLIVGDARRLRPAPYIRRFTVMPPEPGDSTPNPPGRSAGYSAPGPGQPAGRGDNGTPGGAS